MTGSGWDEDVERITARVLTALAGPQARLRDDQRAAVAGLLRPSARVLVVQATGWGKSAVYWAASAVLRARGAGPTLVVSPLLSLMRDQVVAAGRAGLRAATVNSSNQSEWSRIEEDLLSDRIDVLLVSPERLANPAFGARVVDRLGDRLGLLVIDEAHSVSDWGHDFRPDYRRVADLLQRMNPRAPVLATTATANERVTADVAEQLGESTLVQRGPLARNSLDLNVIDGLSPLDRYAWLVDHLPLLPGSGIVYALTVADAHSLAGVLSRRYGEQFPVSAYTGQLPAQERADLEDALRENRVKALVATSALGMGYDKPDLGFVVHVGAPPSPVSYYQQVGRAGRAIERATVVCLPSPQDQHVWDYFASASLPSPPEVERLLAVLPSGEDEPVSVPVLEAESGLRRSKVELLLKQLAVGEVTERTSGGWRATGRVWRDDPQRRAGILEVRRREADIMRSFVAGETCLMALLQEVLDDPSARPCGRCSTCTGRLPAGWSSRPRPETVEALRRDLQGQSQLWEPRRMWPGGVFGRSGRIPSDEAVDPGRVLVHMSAPEWSQALVGSLAGRGPVEPEVLTAAVAALSGWRGSWAARPELIVSFAAAGLPEVASGVAGYLGEVGRIPVVPWELAGGPPVETSTSAVIASAWQEICGMSPPPPVRGRVVLLVVDASATGWSVTVAGSFLRRQGASAVLPLVVHRRPVG
ncbi:ATP-dependent DNA helicase RecQ [Austwickia chelonae]|uniref:DNA 3'-5' helicase n=1 Tax=Austwickia chelonae NBRC 105200 TaxID=1184607 RepID=K6V5C2_9MICO|nr:DEAD/DEAH box helicase [Austwickia chelonae]GAB77413.1 putative ATP-dependent DNA helicase [Austwickia chelonae NBRC 105200]SEW09893.1 ATP-dependent DNA helicase RecQ [Austwickia chelonae]